MRQSAQISTKASRSILHSPRTAEQLLGRPLNYFVTINHWQVGEDEQTIFDEFKVLREQWFASWSRSKLKKNGGRSRNGTPTYTYAHESTRDQPHTHWLVHLEDGNEADFIKGLTRWLRRRYGLNELPEGMVHIQRVYNAEGAKLYLLKGADPHYAQYCGFRTQNTGTFAKRKAGTSANLGPANWRENRQRYRSRQTARTSPRAQSQQTNAATQTSTSALHTLQSSAGKSAASIGAAKTTSGKQNNLLFGR